MIWSNIAKGIYWSYEMSFFFFYSKIKEKDGRDTTYGKTNKIYDWSRR